MLQIVRHGCAILGVASVVLLHSLDAEAQASAAPTVRQIIDSLNTLADRNCGSPTSLNGDSLVVVVGTKLGGLNLNASKQAVASATASAIVASFLEFYTCRAEFIRADDNGMFVNLEVAVDDAFGAINIIGETYPAGRRLFALDSARRAQSTALLLSYRDQPRLAPLTGMVTSGQIIPKFSLMTIKSKGAKLEFNDFVSRILQGLAVTADAKQFAAQVVPGNARVAAEAARSNVVMYADGRFKPAAVVVPIVASVFRIGEQLLATP